MEITYLGHSCFRVRGREATILTDPFSSKYGINMGRPNASIVTISHPHEHHSFTAGVAGDPRIINGPGEYEILNVLISGVRTTTGGRHAERRPATDENVTDLSSSAEGAETVKQPALALVDRVEEGGGSDSPVSLLVSSDGLKLNTAYVIDVDGLRVCHLGDLAGKLIDDQIESMGSIDVLLVPVGGGDVTGPTQAAEVVSQLEPNMVIPMHYKIPGTKSGALESVDRFMREMGSKSIDPVPKVTLNARGSLPADLQVVLLEHKK